MKRRSLFNFYREFAGTRQITAACLGLFGLLPFALLAIGAVALLAYFKNPHATGLAVFGTTTAASGALFMLKGKLLHLVTYSALALGTVAGGGQQIDPAQLNAAQRAAVLANSLEIKQQIYSQSINPTTQLGPVNVPPKNVGLVKRFQVIISGTIQNTDAAVDAVPTVYGIQNILSNIQFTDLQSYTRINTHGPHISNLNTVKGRWPYASALQLSAWQGVAPLEAISSQQGNVFPVLTNLNALVHGTNKAFRMVYDVPLAYSDDDLTGCVYMNVVNSTANLGLTINPNAFVPAGADDTFAVLGAGTCSFLGNLNITVYQVYLDQLPVGQNGVILPSLDISTVYELKNSTLKGIQAGQDFPIPYANFRVFQSVFVAYNNAGTNAGHGIGADINFWALQAASSLNLFKLDPLTMAQEYRNIVGTDLPAGTYYFSHRRKPINTIQYGNMEIVLNAITAGANAYVNVWWEAFAKQNTLTQAGSLS